MSFCKLHCEGGVDLSHALKKAEIPYLSLTREYNLTSAGQIKTRVESFTDILRGI
ncbi:MAG: 2-hydroxyacyl-CoA dehydratase [Dehalococcoidia bacterium]